MNKLSRFNGFGIEDEDKTVTTADGDTEVTVNAEPPKDNGEPEAANPETTDAATDSTDIKPVEENDDSKEDETENGADETTDEDLEINEDDSEEVSEEKEKKIKIEIEIAQEQIDTISQAITSLENISKEMETSLQRGGLPVQGRAIARTSVQHIAKQFGIEQETTSSLESYGYQIDDFHATRTSLENIGQSVLLLKDKMNTITERKEKIAAFSKK